MPVATRPALPTHLRVAASLREKLGSRWKKGDRLPPTNELAALLEAGQRNTNLAVRHLVTQGLLFSRQRLGTFVSEQYDNVQLREIAQADRTGVERVDYALAGRTVAIIPAGPAPDAHFQQMADATRSALLARGATVYDLPRSACNAARPRHVANDLRGYSGAGDALVYINPDENAPLQLHADQIAVVVSPYGQMPVIGSNRCDVVSADEVQGGRLAAQRLREAGCVAPCFLGAADTTGAGYHYDGPSRARFRAFEDAWGEPIPPSRQLQAPRYGEDAGARTLPAFAALRVRPDGVFCAADELAIGFVTGALARGLEAGRDYQIIGFDGQERGRQFAAGPLTTVETPAAAMGRRAAERIARRLLDFDTTPQRICLACRLIEGKTTRPFHGDASS